MKSNAAEAASDWLTLIEKFGVMAVVLVAVVMFMAVVTWTLWRFLKPHLNDLAELLKHLLRKQITFVDTVSAQTLALAQASDEGHGKTHVGIGEVKSTQTEHGHLLDQIHQRVVRGSNQ